MSETAITSDTTETTTRKTARFSVNEDWLAVILGLALVAFTFLSLVRIPW